MNKYNKSIRKVSSISLVLLMSFSLLSPFNNVFAASSVFTTSVIQANVSAWTDSQTNLTATPTPNVVGVTEVKASQTLTIWALPLDTESIIIGTSTVTFTDWAWIWDNSAALDDTDCTWWATINNYTLTNPWVARTPTEIANILDTLTNVTDATHWALTVTADTATTTKFTTTWVENSATDIAFTPSANITATTTVTWVIPVTAVAQVSTVTPANVEVWDTFTATINALAIDYVSTVATVANVTAGLTAAINASAQGANVTAVDNWAMVTITSDVAGTLFTITSGATNIPWTAQIIDFIPSIPTIWETYRATINGTNYDHAVVWVETVAQVVTALQTLMAADWATTCTDATTKITCTADAAWTAFTYSATTLSSVVDLTITLSPGWNVVSTPNTISSMSFSNWWTWLTFYKLEWNTFSSIIASTWTIMPLEWFLVNNTNVTSVDLYLTNETWLTPSEKLHSKTLSAGWNILGTTTNSTPFSTIWVSASSVIDLTQWLTNPNKVFSSFSSTPVYETWEAYWVFMSANGVYGWNE